LCFSSSLDSLADFGSLSVLTVCGKSIIQKDALSWASPSLFAKRNPLLELICGSLMTTELCNSQTKTVTNKISFIGGLKQ
jgi:hypothetical protein